MTSDLFYQWVLEEVPSGRSGGEETNSYQRLVFASVCRRAGSGATCDGCRFFFSILVFSFNSCVLLLSQLLFFAIQHLHQSHDCADVNHALHRCLPCVHVSGGWSLLLIGAGLNRKKKNFYASEKSILK